MYVPFVFHICPSVDLHSFGSVMILGRRCLFRGLILLLVHSYDFCLKLQTELMLADVGKQEQNVLLNQKNQSLKPSRYVHTMVLDHISEGQVKESGLPH